MYVCHCPGENKEVVVLVGEDGSVLVAHPFDRQYIGLSEACNCDLATGDVGSHQVGVQPETGGAPCESVSVFGSRSDELRKFVSRGTRLEVFDGWDCRVCTAGYCAGSKERFHQGTDSDLLQRREAIQSEDYRDFGLIVFYDSAVVEDTDGLMVCSRNKENGFERV